MNQKYAFCIKYSFHNLPVLVNQSKLVQGIAMKEFLEFSVYQNYVFWIKYLFNNLPIRQNWCWGLRWKIFLNFQQPKNISLSEIFIHNVPFRVNQSKLVQGDCYERILGISLNQKYIFWILEDCDIKDF